MVANKAFGFIAKTLSKKTVSINNQEKSMSPGAAAIKHYQIVSCLGQGGFGKVFEAWDSKLQRSVAIKRLNADGLLSPATDLLREARMAASLNHPAFVKIHALEDDENSLAIVMELIKGETLKQVITNNQPDPAQTIKIIRQIAEAMQQAHELGLTHGDLKPSNIMLEPSGNIRILDFGLASKADPEATTSMLQQDPQGTIAYMAPERLLGSSLTPQIDVYALGVIFYELLNGQRPFANLSGLALAAALVQSSSDQWGYPADLPASLIHLIRRMTAKQCAHRLSTMAEVLEQLDAYKNGITPEFNFAQPEAVTQSLAISESPRQLRNKHLKNAMLLSLGIISCVVFGGWFTRNVLWHFEEVIPRYSESQEMKLGMDALEQWDRPGSLDAAIKHFNNLAEQNPENAAAIAGLSIAYSLKYEGDQQDGLWLKKAAAGAQRVIKLNSHLSIGHVAMGVVQRQKNNLSESIEHHEIAINIDPRNFFAWSGKVSTLIAMQRYDEAVLLADESLKRFPQVRAFADLKGIAFSIEGKYSEAESAFRQSMAIQPDSVYAYANLGAVLQYMGRYEEALQVIQQGLQVRPSNILYTNLGNIYFYNGEYLNAVSAFEMAVSPRFGGAMDYLGWANLADALLWVPGKKKEAMKYYRKAKNLLLPVLNRNPKEPTLISRMALYSARLGDKEQCKAQLNSLFSQPSISSDLYFRSGLAYELIGERQLALKQVITAYDLGYPLNMIESEPDLELLRQDPQYLLR